MVPGSEEQTQPKSLMGASSAHDVIIIAQTSTASLWWNLCFLTWEVPHFALGRLFCWQTDKDMFI